MRWVSMVMVVVLCGLGQASSVRDAYGRAGERKIGDVVEPGVRVKAANPRYDARGKKHGKWTYHYKGTTRVYARGRYVHGVVTGTWVWYYKNGRLKRRAGFKDAVLHGVWSSWTEDGQIRSHLKYRMGEIVGVSKEARKPRRKGRLSSHRQISPANFKQGHIHRYKNGILHGKARQWSVKEGHRVTTYDMGDRHGPYVSRYANAYKQLKARGSYRDDRRDGAWTFWSAPCGDMKWTGRFVAGAPDGAWVLWRFDGKTRNYVEVKKTVYQAPKKRSRWAKAFVPSWASKGSSESSCVRLARKRTK